jgi:hypothetical protein
VPGGGNAGTRDRGPSVGAGADRGGGRGRPRRGGAYGVAERGRRGPAVLGALGQRPLDRGGERGRHRRGALAHRARRLAHVLHQHRGRPRRLERQHAGEELVAHHAERVLVAAAVELLLAHRLLGAHVRRGA